MGIFTAAYGHSKSGRLRQVMPFYNEKLDIYVDEVLEEMPKTKFS